MAVTRGARAEPKLISVAVAAALFGVDASFVRAKAKRLALPARYEKRGQGARSRVFTRAEVAKLRPGKPGRPRKVSDEARPISDR